MWESPTPWGWWRAVDHPRIFGGADFLGQSFPWAVTLWGGFDHPHAFPYSPGGGVNTHIYEANI